MQQKKNNNFFKRKKTSLWCFLLMNISSIIILASLCLTSRNIDQKIALEDVIYYLIGFNFIYFVIKFFLYTVVGISEKRCKTMVIQVLGVCITLMLIAPVAIIVKKDLSYLCLFIMEVFFFPNLDFYLNHNCFRNTHKHK